MEPSSPSQESQTIKVDDKEFDELSNIEDSKYKELISTLPRGNGWSKVNALYQYQGFWHYVWFLEGILSVQEHFQAHPTDIIVASTPKSGTTWLKALTFSIVTRTRFDDSTSPLLSKVPHDCIPLLEADLVENSSYVRDPNLPLVATHIPYTSLPKSIIDLGCKIVYIWRDPKDAFVSFWFFILRIRTARGIETISLEDAFDEFCQGISHHGPYWDHVLGYWRARLEFPDKVLFLKYEEMKKETYYCVKKLAEFIGYPFTPEEEEKGVVQRIINMCSFENLSNLEVNKTGKHRGTSERVGVLNEVFFRKGKIGDWQNHLTAEMGARLDSITEKKLKDSGLTNNTN